MLDKLGNFFKIYIFDDSIEIQRTQVVRISQVQLNIIAAIWYLKQEINELSIFIKQRPIFVLLVLIVFEIVFV